MGKTDTIIAKTDSIMGKTNSIVPTMGSIMGKTSSVLATMGSVLPFVREFLYVLPKGVYVLSARMVFLSEKG